MLRSDILAQNIKKCRQKMGLTQNELAEKMFVSGQAISKWESGQNTPDIDNLCALSNIFSTSIEKLIGKSDLSSQEKVFIGIDGGATKTEFVLCTGKGDILHRICAEGTNPNVSGVENAFSTLRFGIDTLLLIRPDVFGVFAGISGCSSGNHHEVLSSLFEKSYPLLKVSLGTDIWNVISGATNLESCIAMICGTGFSIFANEQGTLSRVGGWGYLFDDAAGGYGLGKEAIKAALAEKDGFGKKTVLSQLVEEKIGGNLWENINMFYSGGDSFVASFAPLVFEAYNMGDEAAKDIFEKTTDHIEKLLNFALKRYNCGNNVVVAGGLLNDNDVILSFLKKKVKDVNFIVPTLPQIYGACYKCVKIYDEPDKEFYNNFEVGYRLLK